MRALLQKGDARLESNLLVGSKAIVGSDQQPEDLPHITQHRTGGVVPQRVAEGVFTVLYHST